MKNWIALFFFIAISQLSIANDIGMPVTDYTGNVKLAGKQVPIKVSLNNSKTGEIAVERYLIDNGYKVVKSEHADQHLQISGTIEIVTSNKTKIRDDLSKFLEFDNGASKEQLELLNKNDAVAPAKVTEVSNDTTGSGGGTIDTVAQGKAIALDLVNRNLNYEKKLKNTRLIPVPEKDFGEGCDSISGMKQTVILNIQLTTNNKEAKSTVKSEVKSCALLIDLLTISAFHAALSEITGQ